jgi:phage FluMu gp28-like protein
MSVTCQTLADGTVVLPTGNDPAVQAVKGFSRYWLGVDLAQAQDNTALVCVHDERLPSWNGGRQVLGPRQRTIVFADKFKGVSYPDVVSHVIRTLIKEPLRGRTRLVIDASGLGRVVSDLLFEQGVEHHAIQMTVGQKWVTKDRYVNVGKTLLLETLSVLFATGDLTFAHNLPLREDILAELETFQLETTAAGNQVITQGKSGAHHGDLAIALAAACFASEHLLPGFTGVGQIENWF